MSKRIVEQLAEKVYELEINQAAQARTWAYRKAAWAVEDLEQDIGLVYRMLGLNGLQGIPEIGAGFAGEIEALIKVGERYSRTTEGKLT